MSNDCSFILIQLITHFIFHLRINFVHIPIIRIVLPYKIEGYLSYYFHGIFT